MGFVRRWGEPTCIGCGSADLWFYLGASVPEHLPIRQKEADFRETSLGAPGEKLHL